MVNLVISTVKANGSLKVYVDNSLVLENSGSVKIPVEEGGECVVHWFVTGTAGHSYSITISSPRESYQQTKLLRRAGKDCGTFTFIM